MPEDNQAQQAAIPDLEMALCESERVILRPGIRYQFKVFQNGPRCLEPEKLGKPPG